MASVPGSSNINPNIVVGLFPRTANVRVFDYQGRLCCRTCRPARTT